MERALNMTQTRVLRVFNIPHDTEAVKLSNICQLYGDIFAINQSKVETLGYAYAAYFDLRAAIQAYQDLPQSFWRAGIESDVRVEFVQLEEFERVSLNCGLEHIGMCSRARVLVVAMEPQTSQTKDCVVAKAEMFGQLRAVSGIDIGFACEFFDVRCASNFVNTFPAGKLSDGTSIHATFPATKQLHVVGSSGSETSYSASKGTNSTRSNSTTTSSVDPFDPTAKSVENTLLKSSLTDNTHTLEHNLKHGSLDYNNDTADDRKLGVVTRADVPKNNIVDLQRIAKGLDTRTTLMLRNIPNKVDQAMLKEYIDVTNAKTYEFLYLRIDFANKCNVGYAFISFIAPEHIITFARARAGTKWNRFNSEKICDMSYANIYGKECLVEKFRNSSVMDQDPAYRPLVFYSEGDKVGQEQEFPAPNNMNRKLRSMVSVQRIGLFPPHDSRSVWKR